MPAALTPAVRFRNVCKSYDETVLVVRDLTLDISQGEFITLLGPSGSGKTTTLMMLAGFERPDSGELLIEGRPVDRTPPHRRGIGVVFQNYALFPHMSVGQNIAFPLQVRRVGSRECAERVTRALELVRMEGFADRRPAQLSGGQQQRVALARALVFEPKLVLLDEPLAALDKALREEMQLELRHLHRELGVTMVYVTHDQTEAMAMSDRIAVFSGGVIQQLGTPRDLYDAPANAFVARFIGENNRLPGEVEAIEDDIALVRLACGPRVEARIGDCGGPGSECVVSIRPEHIAVAAATAAEMGEGALAARLIEAIYLGDHVRMRLLVSATADARAPGQSATEVTIKRPAAIGMAGMTPGATLAIAWQPYQATAFHPET
jgi:putative spermidine/putrescine transport system ATP-binding protein